MNLNQMLPSEESKLVKVAGSYLYIPSDKIKIDPKMLMGWSQKKGSPVIVAEDNLVNRIVLGMPFELKVPEASLGNLNPKLEEFQVNDVQKMCSLGNCLNLNRMGSGKTVETIEVLKSFNFQDIVIVTPKPICSQWRDQICTWWPDRSNDIGLFELNKPITVINYEKLLQTSVMGKLRSRRHEAVILDEVHFVKNRDSQRTTAVKLIPAGVHIGLTGTPILRQPDDLWSLLNFVDPRYSGRSYWNFRDYFCNIEDNGYGRVVKGITKDPARLAILKMLLNLVTIQNETEVAHGKRRIEVVLDMEDKQRAFYRNVKKLVFAELPENCTISNGAVLALRLQQATSWPGRFVEDCPGVKFEWIKVFCQGTNEQIVILSRFEKSATALHEYLTKAKIRSTLYTGKQNSREQSAAKKSFIQGKVQVIIGTIGAMGTGVDGLQVARLGIMMERDWSPEINEQCEDRLHRRGQESEVLWYYLTCNKSFDRHVDKVNLNKAESIRAVLEED